MFSVSRSSIVVYNGLGNLGRRFAPSFSTVASELLVANKLNVYGNPRSQPTRSVLMLLHDAGIDHAFHQINNLAGEHRKPEVKKFLKAAMLPSIVTETGMALGEGAAILQYLVDRYQLKDWSSENVDTKAQINFWLHWNHTNTRNGTMQILVPEILYPPPADKAALILAKGQKAHARTCAYLNKHFEETGNKYLVGSEHPTIADLMIVPELDQLSQHGYRLFDYTPYPLVEQYVANVRQAVASYDAVLKPVADKGAEIALSKGQK